MKVNPPAPPAAYRLVAVAGRYRWTNDHREVASALWRDHCWDVHDSEQDRVLVSLVAGSVLGRTKIALVDHVARVARTFVAAEPMTRSHIGEVTDSYGATVLLVRADGPTGLHIIGPDGELLALTSRQRGRESHGCDVLITAAGAAVGTGLLFGVTLVLELLRAGALRHVA